MSLTHRINTIFKANSTDSTRPDFAASYTVTVFPVGAIVVSATSKTYTVDAGHSFRAGDKVLKNPGSDNAFSGTDTVQSVTATTVVMGLDVSASAGDKLVNLGPDTGTSAPTYNNSPLPIYSDADGTTAVSNSRVTTDATGVYSYYHKGDGRFWELIRDGDGTVVDVVPGHMSVPGRFNVSDFGAAGDGTTDDTNVLSAVSLSIPSSGGEAYFPAGSYLTSSVVTWSNPTTVRGASRAGTTIYAKTDGFRAFVMEDDFEIRDISFDRDDVASALKFQAIRIDSPSAGTRCIVENVSITGFDVGVFSDGTTSLDIDLFILRDSYIEVNTGATDVQGTAHLHGCRRVSVENCYMKANAGAYNNVYIIGSENVNVSGNTLENALGVKVTAGDTRLANIETVYIANNYFSGCWLSCLVQALSGYLVKTTLIENNKFFNGDCGDSSAADVYCTGPLHLVIVQDNNWDTVDIVPLRFAAGSGETIECMVCRGNRYYNWNTDANGNQPAIRATSSGTMNQIFVDKEYADGNSNATHGYNLSGVDRAAVDRFTELNTTQASSGLVSDFTDADATPDVSGRSLCRTANTGATTITMLDGGTTGQRLRIYVNDANTTFDFSGTSLKGNGGVDWVASANDHLDCVFNGTVWHCTPHRSSSTVTTFADGDATPSVAGNWFFKTNNTSGATTVTDFADGVLGQWIKVYVTDTNTTFDFTGTNLKGNAGVDWPAGQNDFLDAVYNGTYWLCTIGKAA